MRRPAGPQAAFTLLELGIAVALASLVLVNAYTALSGTSRSLSQKNTEFEVDIQARRALDRIAMALIGATEQNLHVTSASPGSTSTLNYQENLGLEEGPEALVLSDPMRIAWEGLQSGEVAWYENPDTPDQRRVVWVKHVPDLGLGELPNGIDDNGNGLIDEKGLAFVKEGPSVRIVLTVRRTDGNGKVVERQIETVVTCRN